MIISRQSVIAPPSGPLLLHDMKRSNKDIFSHVLHVFLVLIIIIRVFIVFPVSSSACCSQCLLVKTSCHLEHKYNLTLNALTLLKCSLFRKCIKICHIQGRPQIYSQSFNISQMSQIRTVQLTHRFVDHYESILINRSDQFSSILDCYCEPIQPIHDKDPTQGTICSRISHRSFSRTRSQIS